MQMLLCDGQGLCGRAALGVQALADLERMRITFRADGSKYLERSCGPRHVSEEWMGGNPGWNRALGPRRADCEELVGGRILLPLQHRAMMLAVTPAACRKASVRILRERERLRNQRERERREQQDGEQTSHNARYTSVRLGRYVRRVPFLTSDAINRDRCRLS